MSKHFEESTKFSSKINHIERERERERERAALEAATTDRRTSLFTEETVVSPSQAEQAKARRSVSNRVGCVMSEDASIFQWNVATRGRGSPT